MINRTVLLRDLQREVKALEDDLRKRAVEDEATDVRLRREHGAARAAGRTAEPFESWRDDQVTQSAVAWVLACVFVRFLEDNGLLPEPLLSGPGSRRQLALDHRQLFFRAHPTDTDREYLHDVFRTAAKLPAAGDVLGDKHNSLWSLAPSGDGATRVLEFFQRVPPETGELAHDFTDPDWNTRFLGDLYQDLSEAARKKFALLQTPEFVEEFILDRTLTPAIEEFGYKEVRLIDPTCGSGHFLLGAFRRLFELHVSHEPGTNPRELAQRGLDQIAGVDVNPFAIAIARFRLLLAALKASRIERLADAPGFRMHLAAGDSLLHGRRFGLATMNLQPELLGDDPLRKHVYEAEDAEALKEILGRQYQAVVGNPPYITVKDKALNEAYRDAYSSCHRQYSLGVPFSERFFELAVAGDQRQPAGFVGMITANSFMKREFGKKLIEETLPKLDVTHVIDTSGAYIPGHGTPTVIIFGRNRTPIDEEIRTAMGIRGEPETPSDPAQGKVWQSILGQLDSPGSESDFITVEDYARARFKEHPWSLGGGGAAELKDLIESEAETRLGDVASEIGFGAVTREDEVYLISLAISARKGFDRRHVRPLVAGEEIRDWAIQDPTYAIWPYDPETLNAEADRALLRFLWPFGVQLSSRVAFGRTQLERGLAWFEYSMFFRDRFRTPLSIAFAEVATHNHFVLDWGGKVFNRTAPVIKLPPNATEDDHLVLLALLNSSTACFWMKQVSHDKGAGTDKGKWQDDPAKIAYQFTATHLHAFPIPRISEKEREQLCRYARDAARQASEMSQLLDQPLHNATVGSVIELKEQFTALQRRYEELRARLVSIQEEIDWLVLALFNLVTLPAQRSTEEILDQVQLGARPFEIAAARRGAKLGTDGQRLQTAPPLEWTDDKRRMWEARIALLEANKSVGLIEASEHKRRWLITPKSLGGRVLEFEERVRRALALWLLDRLESLPLWATAELQTVARLADRARQAADFMRVAELYCGHPDFDVTELVRDFVYGESVPILPVSRYTPLGIRKRAQWESTWELQRHGDEINARTRLDSSDPQHLTEEAAAALKREVGDIPVPPRYTSADFLRKDFWQLRGKLDVPKERFVSFPCCEREADPSLVIAWAGWDHLQLAQATAAYYVAMKDTEGWSRGRLTPLLAALAELVPWLRQWHNEIDPEYGVGMGDYFANFVNGETRSLSLTPADLKSWTPPTGNAVQRKVRAARKTA